MILRAAHKVDPSVFESAIALWRFCAESKVRLVTNHTVSMMGHFVNEADNFGCMKQLGEIDPNCRYALIQPPHPALDGLAECTDCFDFVIADNRAFWMSREVAIFQPEFTVDIGNSDLKMAPPRNQPYYLVGHDFFACKTSWQAAMDLLVGYYRRRNRAWDAVKVWKRGFSVSDELAAYLGLDGSPLALIHVRGRVGNAAAAVTDPASYGPALGWLRDHGFRLVCVGRDPMPRAFDPYGVVDYARSPWASVSNDLRLFSQASFALIDGSGLGDVAGVFDVPFVHINSWHVFAPPLWPGCVFAPAIVEDSASGRALTFSEIGALFSRRAPFESWDFPASICRARPVQPDEILAATQQALTPAPAAAIPGPDPFGLVGLARSRLSSHFAAAHSDLVR